VELSELLGSVGCTTGHLEKCSLPALARNRLGGSVVRSNAEPAEVSAKPVFWGADRLVDTQAIHMAEHKKWCATF